MWNKLLQTKYLLHQHLLSLKIVIGKTIIMLSEVIVFFGLFSVKKYLHLHKKTI